MEKEQQRLKIAQVLIIAQLVFIIVNLIKFYQVKFQLVSDLISETVIIEITEPYVLMSMILSCSVIISFVLYFRGKITGTISISSIVLVGQFIFKYFISEY